MKLVEFFEFDTAAPFAQAFTAVRQALNRHVDTLDGHTASPWTMRLGKGGAKPDGGEYPGPEQSLYRHCTEVAVLAAWLFYHAWATGRPLLSALADPVPALKTLLAIAYAHDADKRIGAGKSRSPTLEDVAAVYAELDMATWSGLCVEEMHAAVSRVETRGLKDALFGEALIDPRTDKLAELVKQADNLLSRAAREGGDARALVAVLNEDLPRLHRLYGTPEQSLQLLQFRHQPIVIYQLHRFLSEQFYGCDYYPLVLARRGEWLDVAFPEHLIGDAGEWLDQFEEYLADTLPSLKVNPPNGTVTPFNIGCADDLMAALIDDPRQSGLLLRVSSKDWDAVSPLANFWVMRGGAPLATTTRKGNLCQLLEADGDIRSDHPYWRAAALAAAQAMVGKAGTHRLLAEDGVAEGLRHNGIDPEKNLDGLSLRTATALQASLLYEDPEAFHACLERIQGPWPKRAGTDPGAQAIVTRLKAQAGWGRSVAQPLPYGPPGQGDVCLICGTPAKQVIKTGAMKLAGVKATSFANRIGHEKHLWSERGENYLCPACIRVQGLLLQEQPKLRGTPMLVATPVRHLLDTRSDDRIKGILRSYDAVSKEGYRGVLPWNADAGFDQPLLFEERPTAFEETIHHLYRLARYAELSGEPVHAFIASPRECKAAFLYEGMPELLKELLQDLINNQDGISRSHIGRLVRRLELFRAMLEENDGMGGMQAMPRYGWWATAFVFSRSAKQDKNGWNPRHAYYVNSTREEYPMTEYDQWLDTLIRHSIDIYKPKRDASGAEWTLPLRIALETYQKHYAFGPQTTQDAIAQSLRANLTRRHQDDLYRKDLDERLQSFAEAAHALLAKGAHEFELESGFLRFLFAAYEGGYRRQVAEFWKQRKELNDLPPNTTGA